MQLLTLPRRCHPRYSVLPYLADAPVALRCVCAWTYYWLRPIRARLAREVVRGRLRAVSFSLIWTRGGPNTPVINHKQAIEDFCSGSHTQASLAHGLGMCVLSTAGAHITYSKLGSRFTVRIWKGGMSFTAAAWVFCSHRVYQTALASAQSPPAMSSLWRSRPPCFWGVLAKLINARAWRSARYLDPAVGRAFPRGGADCPNMRGHCALAPFAIVRSTLEG